MDRLLNDFTEAFGMPDLGNWGARSLGHVDPFATAPGMVDVRFDVTETNEAIEVTAEVPGMSEEDVDVELSGDILTIKGEKQDAQQSSERNRHLSERRYGSFQRSFALPDSIDRDAIDATFDKGVLTVSLPKTREAKTENKKIQVRKG